MSRRSGALKLADLQLEARSTPATVAEQMAKLPFREAKDLAIQHFHRQYIRNLLEDNGGNVSRAAEAAGIQRQYLHRLIKEAGLETTDFKLKE